MPATHTKDELHRFLKPGMKLSTNFEFGPKDQYTYSTTYLGMKENAYLILDIPMRLLEEQVMRKLPNADIIVRGVSDTELGHVIAFKSSVLTTTVRPSPFCLSAFQEHLQPNQFGNMSVTSCKWTVTLFMQGMSTTVALSIFL